MSYYKPPQKRRYKKPRAQTIADWAFGVLILAGLVALLISGVLKVVNGQEPTPAIDGTEIERNEPEPEPPHSVLLAGTFDALANPGATVRDDVGVPPRGWSMPIEVVDVWDGDTVTVELRMQARVRLVDCWAPELKDKGGDRSRQRLADLCAGKRGVLYVSRQGDGRLDKHFTFGRLLGQIWMEDDVSDLSSQMVEGGFATKEKPQEPQ